MWVEFNPNRCGKHVGDCAVRAISAALHISWEQAYMLLTDIGLEMCDMPSSDAVWGALLRKNGFTRKAIPSSCPDCYTADDFARDNPQGIFVLGFGGHVATIVDSELMDAWDSSREVPQFVWYRR